MKLIKKSLVVCFCVFTSLGFAQRGKDGNVTVNAANRIVNEYTTLTADAATGATTITVAASGLNANGRFSGSLAAGDLIMIIQMQGISVNGSSVEFPAGSGQFYGLPNDNTLGAITAYNNCGNYEFAEVNAVPSGTSITLDCGLLHDYTSAGRVQVIRVPRYNTLTVTSPGTIVPQTWAATGFTGGVVAIEVLGNTSINNASGINASALGFRGGSLAGDNASGLGGGQVARNSNSEGAEKGEGIFGYQADYNVLGGRYARAAIGNAGGGANCHNSGGGGGANAGSLVGWDGLGNPDVSGGAGWVSAWNLEGGGFSAHTSPGGGRGGYSFSSANRDATVEGPQPFQSGTPNSWGGDSRENNGGWGGRNADYSTGRLFMGGGGGAGDQDNNVAGAGGRAGGLIYLMSYGTVSGTGTVTANGANGADCGHDGGGGGGAGGTIVINSVGLVSGISISATGGNGGNQTIPAIATMQAEGPGGSGGGGYIAVSTGAVVQNVNPGANGTTSSTHLSEFPPNGATKGAVGLANQTITNFTIAGTGATICAGNTASISATLSGTVPGGTTILWYTAAAGGSSIGSGSPFTTPVLATTTTYYVGTCPGTYRVPVVVTVNPSPTITLSSAAATAAQSICLTAPITNITYTVGGSATGATVSGLPAGVNGSFAAGTFTISGTPTATGTFNYTVTTTGGSCPAVTATGTITINSNATISLASAAGTPTQTVCQSTAITNIAYTVGGGGTGAGVVGLPAGVTGSFAAGTFTISGTPTATGTFNYTVTTTGTCTQTTATGTITVNPNATIALSSAVGTNAQTLCATVAITNITYTVGGGGTGATVSGLPAGVTGSFAAGTFTISGTPTATGTFNYTVTTTGTCTQTTATGTITVNPNATIALSSAVGTNAQTLCQSAAITNITYTIGGGGTNATVSGLPAGVTGSFAAGTFTISGTPTATGTFNYTVTTTGTCTQTTATGTITVNPNATIALSSAVGSNAQTLCQSVAITNITYTIGGGGTGAGVVGLPAGVTGSFAAGTFTISGTPTATGTFNYTVTTTGTCTQTTATGTITVNPNATIALSSAVGTNAQTLCESTAVTNITYTVGGGGTNATVSGLPAGVTGSFAAGTFTISGTPTATGTFNYTVTTTGTCTQTTATGTITVNPNAAIALSSAVGSDAQTLCASTAITSITYTVSGGGTGATVSGLPAGVTGSFAAGTFTISGTPSATGTFNYTVTTTGTCAQTTANGSITINPDATIALSSAAGTDAQTLCSTNAITAITYTVGGGGTNATVSGLPAGVTGSFAAGTFTISGTPTVTGTFNYTITTTGTCAQTTASGSITINPLGDATINNVALVCVSASAFNMTAVTAGGTWSGTGITDAVNGTFNPATAGVGTYTITYTIAGACGSTDTALVTVGTSSDATISAVSSICIGAPAFALTAATAGGTWSGTGITNAATGTFDPATAGIGSFVITYTISGTCGATDTATVVVTSLSDVTIANATPVCVGANAFNLSAATAGGTWTGTGITDGTLGTFDPATAGIGTFTVTYTLGGSCGNVDTALVTITPNSNPTITPPGSLCLTAPAVNLSAATAGGTWTGTGITNGATGTFDPSVSGIGTFTVTYTITGVCGAVDSISITVNASADATITTTPAVCVDAASFNLSAATLGGTWSGTGITNASAGTFDPATAGVGTFVVTYTVSGACSAVDTATIVVNALPAISVNSPTICAGQTATLTAGGGTSYSWSAGAISTGLSTADATPASTATYTVTGTASGCSNTAVATVTVTPLPTIGVNSPTICAGQTAGLTATGGTSYTWSAGATVTGVATADVNPMVTSSYTVTGTNSGCSNTAISTVTVNALPTPAITSDLNSGCAPLCVQFTESVSTICSSVSYDFGDGLNTTSSDPLHCYVTSGSYTVVITCTDANGCMGSTSIPNMINVDPTPVADITISPTGIVAPNTSVTFTDASTGGGTAFWNFGDPTSGVLNTSSFSTDTHAYGTEGTYCITLISTNATGCADTASECIVVAADAIISVPNVFTPNGDGDNDMFFISSTSVKELTCSIYDRWGLKLAEWNTVNGGWDGRTTSGNYAPDGVYYYILKVTGTNEKIIEQQGFLQLLNK